MNVVAITLFPNNANFGHITGDYQQLFRNGLALDVDGTPSVPEPATISLLSLGLLAVGGAIRKRAR